MPYAAQRVLVRRAGALLALAAALAGLGCRGSARPADRPVRASDGIVRPVESRIDTILGRMLVMPVSVQGALDPKRPVLVRLDDGRRPTANLYWISDGIAADAGGWLPAARAWAATPFDAARLPSPRGTWVLTVELPLDAVGQGLWLGEHHIAINWLPDPGSLLGGDEVWSLPVGPIPPTSPLLRLAEPESRSPLGRWRYHLLLTGLRPDARAPLEQDLTEPAPGADVFPDPILEALARQAEARWQVALANLWLAEPELAHRLKRRLAAAVDFGNGFVAPAWPTDQAAMDALLSDLLNPRLPASQKADRARNWVESQPQAVAWVIDDSGLRDMQTGRPIATCGIANLTERDTLAWAAPADGSASSGGANLSPVSSLGIVRLPVLVPAPEEPPSRFTAPTGPRPFAVSLHAGSWSAVQAIAHGAIPASPPGAQLGPLVGDWTLASWSLGTPGMEMTPRPEWAAAAILYREDAPIASAGDRPASTWVIYVECRLGPGQAVDPPPPESVRIWLGPLGSPRAVLRIGAGGSVVDERAYQEGDARELRRASVSTDPAGRRWTARVPIPARCIEPDGTLRLAFERLDARGQRSTWPRPQLPWQTEPGRAMIDTTTWDRGPR
jgi:hypothetical protein